MGLALAVKNAEARALGRKQTFIPRPRSPVYRRQRSISNERALDGGLLDKSLGAAVLRLQLRFTNQLFGIGLRGPFARNRPVNVTAWGLHARKQSIAAFIACVASHYWRIMIPIELLRPTTG